MTDSLASQIVVDSTDVFYPVKGISLKKVGGKRVLNRELFLKTVKRLKSLNNSSIANILGLNRSTVYRFKANPINADVIEEAEEYIERLSKCQYRQVGYDVFIEYPIIREWVDVLNRRRVSKKRIDGYIRPLFNLCNLFKVHPSKLNLNRVAEFVIAMRTLYLKRQPQPRRFAYTTIREGVRSFYMCVHNLSAQFLTNIGIDKSASLGQGKYSKQKVSKIVRHRFDEVLEKIFMYNRNTYLELLNIAKFMYCTGTRITAVLEFNFKDRNYSLENDIWMLEVLDKGQNGGILWEKYLIGHALIEFKDYCSERFNIPINELGLVLQKKVDSLFPRFKKASDVSKIFKKVLIEAGLSYKDFPPTHIFRHTFAQEFLRASDWNYVLCASLGGWVNTLVIKRHYGAMGYDPKIRGLKKSMGIPVEDETYELRW